MSPESQAAKRAYDRRVKRQAYATDPEKFKVRVRERRAANHDLLATQSRARYAADPEKFQQQKRQSRARDVQRSRDGVRRWRESHPSTAWALRQRARGAPATPEAIAYVEQIWNDPCAYCGKRKLQMTIDHIVPVCDGGRSVSENLTRACRTCNDRKHDQSVLAFLSYLSLLPKRQRLREYNTIARARRRRAKEADRDAC